MRLSPLRYTEEIQVKKTIESTRDREEILFEKKVKELSHLNEKEAEKKPSKLKKSQPKRET